MTARHRLTFEVPAELLAVYRLAPDAPLPPLGAARGFVSVVRTADELSVICPLADVPDGALSEGPWRALRLCGPFPMTLVGVLLSVLQPLADAGLPIMAVSTFDTDYVLVRAEAAESGVQALVAAGHVQRDARAH